ncbi:MAG: GNAT family N-acetyltransferase [Thermomicrobiales bacterium]
MSQETPIDASASIWQGERVRLRAIEPADWATYFAWDRDEEQSRSLYAVPFPRSEEATRRWAEAEATREREGDNFRFVIENQAGEAVGDLTIHDCDARVGTLSYGLNIRKEHRRKGYAAEAIRLVLRYYFEERRYQKVTVGVYSFNEASIRLHEKLGFQREGCLRRTVFTRGRHFDEIKFGLTAEEFAAAHPDYSQ